MAITKSKAGSGIYGLANHFQRTITGMPIRIPFFGGPSTKIQSTWFQKQFGIHIPYQY